MKFIDQRVALSFLVLLLVSGCSSLDNVFTAPEEATQVVPQAPAQDAASGSQDAPALTPMQQKVLELRQQPNLYASGQSAVDAHTASLFRKAVSAKNDGDLQQAQQQFLALTTSHPSLSGPWMQLGDVEMAKLAALSNAQWDQQQALLAEAKTHYEKALSVNPHNYFARNRLARVYRELGEFAAAEEHYLLAIKSYPAHDNSYLNIGILYDLYMGKKQLAMEHYEVYQALQDKPQRKVRGWIADLKRQIAKAEQVAGGGSQ